MMKDDPAGHSGPTKRPILNELGTLRFGHGHLFSFSWCKIEYRGLVFRAGTCNQSYGPYESAWDCQVLLLVFFATSKCGYRQSLYKDSSRRSEERRVGKECRSR